MSIHIRRTDSGYEANVEATPHHATRWQTERPMTRRELVEALFAQGCHQQDIGDAFYEADPEWLLRDPVRDVFTFSND